MHQSPSSEGKSELPKCCSCPAFWWLHPRNVPKRVLICFTVVFTSESSLVLCILDTEHQALQRTSLCHVKSHLSAWKSQAINSKVSSEKPAPPQPRLVALHPRVHGPAVWAGPETEPVDAQQTAAKAPPLSSHPFTGIVNQLLWLQGERRGDASGTDMAQPMVA